MITTHNQGLFNLKKDHVEEEEEEAVEEGNFGGEDNFIFSIFGGEIDEIILEEVLVFMIGLGVENPS